MKRFTAEPFFDTGWEKNRYWDKTYHSYGIEISAATHFFRLPFPVNIGFRTGYETKSNSMFVDMLFSVAFTIYSIQNIRIPTIWKSEYFDYLRSNQKTNL